MEEVQTQVPMVIRLVGTQAEKGRELLAEASMTTAETLVEAAQKSVKLAKGGD
jgi:succinyl-CoA synthetase beta subunit